ncbi:MAG: hypothetical protein HOQ21_01370 [Dermatophilaceae bacterium]|nr:hypothetical protein [Dermatophilaceae bacterium]
MGPYDRTTYGGKTVDALTRAALDDTAERLGYPLTILQGSFNAGGVAASAGTHDGGGAVDLAPYDWERKVLELRRTGFAAWHRPAIPGLWGEHIHAVLIGDRLLSAGAKAQVADYLAGRNGLANHGPDDGPRDFVNNRYHWQRGAHRITRAAALMERARLLLGTGIRGYKVGKSRKALRDAASQLPKAGA